jgi:hypothetical protein
MINFSISQMDPTIPYGKNSEKDNKGVYVYIPDFLYYRYMYIYIFIYAYI